MNNNILKDMIFISHAEEDNDFTMWLALQLANKGYGVWCDLTKLLGGEDWPREINYALQTRTQKFLFVLSKYSNQKHNPQGELTSAFNIMRSENLDNLIVPLKIDDLEYSKIDFRLQNIQSINFFDYWAEGLSQLLRMLERDNVKKHSSFTPDAVNYWWNNYKSVANTVSYTPEELFSNRYPIIHYPQFIYTHHVTTKIPKLRQFVPYSFIPFKRYLLTYTEAELLYEYLNLKILDTRKVDIHEFINGKSNIVDNSQEAKRIVARLYNQIFQKA